MSQCTKIQFDGILFKKKKIASDKSFHYIIYVSLLSGGFTKYYGSNRQ